MPSPQQRKLPLTIHADSRLVSVSFVKSALGIDAESVLTMIEDGRLEYAFNLATRLDGIREIRVVAESVKRQVGMHARTFADLDDVIQWLVPDPHTTIHGEVLVVRWECSRPHIKALYDAGEITGHKTDHTRHLQVASLREFLRRRRIT